MDSCEVRTTPLCTCPIIGVRIFCLSLLCMARNPKIYILQPNGEFF